ncbi:hypothetical protein KFL_000690260 [Klebsormidium nitens]|uniref:Fe2OG dioxygenase domain-containing protein n=1 Tax=Klebsormidium nitens TaxID=105231 RepID=A0A1Y1HYV8_KLENI|nr:hypothetical protein KFL_000690260 [Klebsormidium nitens]|eukprot:GAQ81048.1 hypothetical protein KFL_000690260 [Klebsormidium nitens]
MLKTVVSFLEDTQTTYHCLTFCRKALKLDPSAFTCSFQVSDYGILSAIQKVMTTEDKCIRTELHKLNVYRAGDFFKAHVDTPRGPQMFGSLIICLPSAHNGGNLRISHGKKNVNIDWSEKSEDHIQWVALYSDCEHEVKEVLGGYRVTLTYNLYADPLPGPRKSPLTHPNVVLKHTVLYQTLVKALSLDSFMHDGGILGLSLQHRYPHVSEVFVKAPEMMLKGADAVIFAVAKQLGLETQFVQVYYDSELDQLDVQDVSTMYENEEERGLDHLRNNFRLSCNVDYNDVTWCVQGSNFQEPGKIGSAYGNEPSVEVHYCVAALLVVIPEWGEDRGKLLTAAEEDTV